MEITISNLQNRFNFFSYSAFQKYKNDKCENKPFFSCKKDFYQYLEKMYLLEFNSRKKLFNILNEEDFLILSLIFEEDNNINNLSTNLMNSLLRKESIISTFSIGDFYIGEKISKEKKLDLFLQLSNKFNALKLEQKWSELDEFLLLQILKNLKRFFKINDNYTNFFDLTEISQNIITIFPQNENLKTKIIFNLKKVKTHNIFEVYEEENINSKIIKSKLREPKWILKYNENLQKYSYMDHKFNFLTIDYKNRKIFYNGVEILGTHKLFQLNETNKNKSIVYISKKI